MFNNQHSSRLYREDLAVSGQLRERLRIYNGDYTERIWRYQDNYTTLPARVATDYTERIWRYQDNTLDARLTNCLDYTERIWRYQDNCVIYV